MEFYNYCNLNSYMNQLGINYNDKYFKYVKDIINTKVQQVTYEGLDNELTKGLESRDIELALMYTNNLCWYYSSGLNKVILGRYTWNTDFGLYFKPKTVDIFSLTGQPIAYQVSYDDIVPMRDNAMDLIPFLILNSHIQGIIEVEKSLESILRIARLPLIAVGDKEQVIELRKLVKDVVDCKPFIVASKGYKDHFEQFDIKQPTQLEQIKNILEYLKQETYKAIGIYQSTDKRERIIVGEQQAQNDFVNQVYQDSIECRKKAINEVNKRWNLNIKVVETYVTNAIEDSQVDAITIHNIEKAKNVGDNNGN